MAHHPRVSKSSSAGSLNDAAAMAALEAQTNSVEEPVDLDHLTFTQCHSGPSKQHEVKGLYPWTTYHFRVQVRCRDHLFHVRTNLFVSSFHSVYISVFHCSKR